MVRTRRKEYSDEYESDHKKWEVIYKGLTELASKRTREVLCLRQQLQILERRHSHSDSDSDSFLLLLLRTHIAQLKRELELSKLSHSVEIAKADFTSGFDKRAALLSKSKLDHATSELDDFISCFHILSQPHIPPDSLFHHQTLLTQLASLKRQSHDLSLNHTSQLSSLHAEIKFAWNQFNEKERIFTNQLQAKSHQLTQANDKISLLLDRLDRLHSSNSHKDQLISTLRANIISLENESRQKDEIIINCSKELELFKSNSLIGISTLTRCSAQSPSTSKRTRSSRDEEPSSSAQIHAANASLRSQLHTLQIQANLKNEEIARLSKELNSFKSKTIGSTGSVVPKEEASPKGGKRSKRKRADLIGIGDTPRLFTSEFRVPKLRSQSPDRR